MPRTPRVAPGGWIFHVLNRRSGKGPLFESAAAYREFLGIVAETAAQDRMRILAYCAMPTHWHMLLWPRENGDLARFVHRISMRHAHRWQLQHNTSGRGHVYQARYKSFPVRDDTHLLTVCRYIERNPLRAGLVEQAQHWPWSSAARQMDASCGPATTVAVVLEPLPVAMPADWQSWVHEPQTDAELNDLRKCLRRDLPFGDSAWQETIAMRTGVKLEPSRGGRPRKQQMLFPVNARTS